MRLLLSLLALLTTVVLIYAIICVISVNRHEMLVSHRLPVTNSQNPAPIPAYMISLTSKKEERSDITFPSLKAIFPQAQIVSAVDAKGLSIDDKTIIHPFAKGQIQLKYDMNHDNISSMGAVGCALSHINLWKKCVEMNTPIVISEDDTFYTPKHLKEIEWVFPSIPADADFAAIIYINFLTTLKPSPSTTQWGEIQTREFHGTQLYYITPRFCKELLKDALPIVTQIDAYVSYVLGVNENFKGYAWKRNPAPLLDIDAPSTLDHFVNIKKFLPESNGFYYIFAVVVIFLIIGLIIVSTRKCSKTKKK